MDYCRHHITSSTQTILLHDRSYLSHSESEQYKLLVIQGPDQDLTGMHQRLRDSMSGRVEVWFRSPTKHTQKNKPRVQ